MSLCLGIDLGTTSCRMAVYRNGGLDVIPSLEGSNNHPAYVAFTDSGCLIGERAQNLASVDPENCINNTKHIMGRLFEDPEVQADIRKRPYSVGARDGRPVVRVRHLGADRELSPIEITATLLERLKTRAEAYLGTTVTSAVITVPAFYTSAQREATRTAAFIAGLNVFRLLNDATAVGVWSARRREDGSLSNSLIVNFGGGTLSVSLVAMENGIVEVLGTAGDCRLSGEEIDTLLLNHFIGGIPCKYDDVNIAAIRADSKAISRLRAACQQIKHSLSTAEHASQEIDYFFKGRTLKCSITRAEFESLCHDLFQATLRMVDTAHKEWTGNRDIVDEVILVGGTTTIPAFTTLMSNHFKGKPIRKVTPEARAYGAGLYAAMLGGDSLRRESRPEPIPHNSGVNGTEASPTGLGPMSGGSLRHEAQAARDRKKMQTEESNDQPSIPNHTPHEDALHPPKQNMGDREDLQSEESNDQPSIKSHTAHDGASHPPKQNMGDREDLQSDESNNQPSVENHTPHDDASHPPEQNMTSTASDSKDDQFEATSGIVTEGGLEADPLFDSSLKHEVQTAGDLEELPSKESNDQLFTENQTLNGKSSHPPERNTASTFSDSKDNGSEASSGKGAEEALAPELLDGQVFSENAQCTSNHSADLASVQSDKGGPASQRDEYEVNHEQDVVASKAAKRQLKAYLCEVHDRVAPLDKAMLENFIWLEKTPNASKEDCDRRRAALEMLAASIGSAGLTMGNGAARPTDQAADGIAK